MIDTATINAQIDIQSLAESAGAKIPLTQGLFAYVDQEDYEYLIQWRWSAHKEHNKYYAVRHKQVDGKKIVLRMHAVILKNSTPGLVVDHIDGDGLNNTKKNLRLCSPAENLRNRGKQINNTSGYKGVFLDKRRGKWYAQICVDRKKITSPNFLDKKDAVNAYNELAKKHHGVFGKGEI